MSEDVGYIYRVARANAPQLQALIARHVVGTGWIFGGAAQWDFETGHGRANLRQITELTVTGAPDLRGDFGHAFSRAAEVRWKRRDDGDYDVLVLSENRPTVEDGEPLRVCCLNGKTGDWEEQDWRLRRSTKAKIVLGGKRSGMSYIDYLAPNGAVQFQRLVEVQL